MADKRTGRVRPYPKTVNVSARWLPDKKRVLIALRGGWSANHIQRIYGVPAHITSVWRDEYGIPKPTKPRPTPEMGTILT